MTTVREDTSRLRPRRRAHSARTALLRAMPIVAVIALALIEELTDRSARSASGLRVSSPFITWMLPLTRGWLDVATFATLGALVTARWLLPRTPAVLVPTGLRVLRLAGHWSLVWSAAALCHSVVTTAQLLGIGAREVLTTPALYPLLWRVPQSRALLVVALVGLVVHVCCTRARDPRAAGPLLVAASLSVVPLLVNGHAATASNHYVASQSLVVHVLSASLWVGGLMVVVLHLRSDRLALQAALPRFSTLASWCYLALGLSGVVGALVRLDLSWASLQSTYGALVVAKVAALLVLGLLGMAHRAWSLPSVAAGRRLAFLRFAAAELVLMATATVLAVLLARTPPPVDAAGRTVPLHTGPVSIFDRGIEPLGVRTLLTGFRPDVLVLTVLGAVLVAYLVSVAHLVRAGGSWRAGRSALFVAGVLLAGWCLCGGLGVYSGALFSVEVARLLTMGLLVPVLVTAGAPVTLVRACTSGGVSTPRSGRLDRQLADPVNGLLLLVGVLGAALMTPLLEASLRSPTAHLALPVTATAAGLVFVRALSAVERGPRRASGDGAVLVAVLAGLLLVYAAHLATSPTLFAADWYARIGLSWSDPVTDQHRSAFVVAGFGLALLAGAQLRRGRHERASGSLRGR